MSRISLRVDEEISIDIEDVLEEIETEDLITELKKRKQEIPVETIKEDITNMAGYQIRTCLQDLFQTSHVISDEELLTTIKSYLQ